MGVRVRVMVRVRVRVRVMVRVRGMSEDGCDIDFHAFISLCLPPPTHLTVTHQY